MSNFITGTEPNLIQSIDWYSTKFKKLEHKNDVWLVPINISNPGDYVHVYQPRDQEGFGGKIVDFMLEDGTITSYLGPWHSNAEALFIATGYDVRDKHLTYVVISRNRDLTGYNTTLQDVIYNDTIPQIGLYDRGQRLAQQIANETNEPLYFYTRSTGGSHCGKVEPK